MASAYCPPFPQPDVDDELIVVGPAQAGALPGIVAGADANTTILLQDGVYAITANLNFGTSRVTLRSLSGNAAAVVLDGEYRIGAGELIRIAADNITVADLTIQRVWYHPVHIVGGGHYATLYNLRIRDGREQFVKVNPENGEYADFGLAACLDLELTPAGRVFIQENPTTPFLCYTGGFDLHQTWGWTVRDSVFRNFYCTNGGLSQHAIHFFSSNREPTVERNLILNSARGIGFGLGQIGFLRSFPDDPFAGTEMEGREAEVMQIGGSIVNNMIFADIGFYYDSGISLESAWKPQIVHNTIYSEQGAFNSAIDVRFSGSVNVELTNNLYYPVVTLRAGAPTPLQQGNVLATAGFFVSSTSGDLHLLESAFAAIDQGVWTGLAGDIDGHVRDATPDVGADEFAVGNTPPSVVVGSPLSGSTYDLEALIPFGGSASDDEDGDLTPNLTWSSSLTGALGIGGSFSMALPAGEHLVTAEVIDLGGLKTVEQIGVTVTSAECPLTQVVTTMAISSHEVHRAIQTMTVGLAVTVEQSGALELRSGQSISVEDGFSVVAGGAFSAGVFSDPCS